MTTTSLIETTLKAAHYDLTPFHDLTTVLKNPHKGWYHHYFDNSIEIYIPSCDADLEEFPGLTQLYLRLAWSHLEPQQGVYNWALIDDVINKWIEKGFSISFRITCKETDIPFATPEWVRDMGVPGEFYPFHNKMSWRPDYGHPLFLEHLEQFHRAFAARYDGQPWVDSVDIGSYGQWGEAHNFMSGEVPDSIEVVKAHIDIHLRHYKKSLLVISDDVVGDRTDDGAAFFTQYIHDNGISVRDDSVLVRHYVEHYPETFSLRSPELFQQAADTLPTILELQHYGVMKDTKIDGTWAGRNGEERGGEMFVKALRLARATWIGYHGDAREWLDENPELTVELANLAGYWLFPMSIRLPRIIARGTTTQIAMEWFNRGVAPVYHRYALGVRLTNGAESHQQELTEADPRAWAPGEVIEEEYEFQVPAYLATGSYSVDIRLAFGERTVLLGLNDQTKLSDGYYRIGSLTLA